MTITAEQLARATGAQISRAKEFLPHISAAMQQYDITTPARQCAFLAQIGHESGGLRYTKELWGPTPVQMRYEGRLELGNTEPGDGRRFMGRGLIQITGRANYRAVARLCVAEL
jgi:putative chitinase